MLCILKERMMKNLLAAAALASLAFSAQAQPSASTSTTMKMADKPTSATSASTVDILALVKASETHKTLASLLKDDEVSNGVLSGKSMTLFAPTDEAFAKLPKDALAALAGNKKELIAVLSGHVLMTAVTSDKLTSPTVKTEAKTELAVKKDGDTLTVGGAKVLKADMKASNGVVYSVDSVLMPKPMEMPMAGMKMDMKMSDMKTTATK